MGETPEHIIELSRPVSGSAFREDMEPGCRHMLDFYPEDATFEADGPDLRLTFDDGAVLTLAGFFPALDREDFILELPDGTLLSGRDVRESLTLALEDFHTDANQNDEPDPGDGNGVPFFAPDEPSGLLCHDSCGLFDESFTLPGAPDPLFDVHMTPLPRPAPAPDVPDATPMPGASGPGPACALLQQGLFGPELQGDILRQEDMLSTAQDDASLFACIEPRFAILNETLTHETPQHEFPAAAVPGDDTAAETDWLLAFLRLGAF